MLRLYIFTFALVTAVQAQVVIDPFLRQRAIEESATPVREGVPFWNQNAVQFQFAPSFDFKPVTEAKTYRFSIQPAKGESLVFTADKSTASLAPIWTQLSTGKATLTVRGLDASGHEVGEPMTRSFHRAAVIPKSYAAPALPWKESARTALDALVHSPDLKCWFTTGVPEEKFHLYRYPSKIIGAAAAALAIYATQTPSPADAAPALQASRQAADYLLAMCFDADSAWAFHPPTYHPTMFADRIKGHMNPANYMTNCGAEGGGYFLDVYAATKDAKYLDAAKRIAETYAKQQRSDGSWLLFVTPRDGQAVKDNVLIPTLVIQFLERLAQVTEDHRFDGVRDKAIAWMMQNPVKTWNWQGQFEDVQPQPPYENLTKHEAGDFAIHLLETAAQDAAKRQLALDLIRFAEDQFVMWSQPPADSPNKQNDDGNAASRTKRWMLPCVLEQYRCWAPVCASSAKLIRMYLAAYRATNDPLHLEKAKALASTLTHTQSTPKAPGRYQTWVMQNPPTMWFNCELMAIRVMRELAEVDAIDRK
jgi:maltose/maltodextrin transport system substrate-binding protein